MRQKFTLIGVMTSGHFVLWWLVVGALQWTRCDYFFWFGRELSFPLIALEDMPWPPFSWFRFILAVVLNSGVWGVSLGILLYAVRQRVYKSVVKIAAHNAGWPSQFRFAVHGFWSGMCELGRSPKK